MARLGLDFGTTNSAIAVYSDGQLRMLPADPKNENPFVTPSLIYFDRQGAVTVGTDAAQRYLEAGFNFVTLGSDAGFMMRAAADDLATLRNADVRSGGKTGY